MNTVRNNQVWRDNKAAGTRYIQILNELDENGRVVTATVYRGEAGELPVEIKDASRTSARLDRFNGKHDGYTLVAQSLTEFRDKKLYLVDFLKPESEESEISQVDLGKLVVCRVNLLLHEDIISVPTVDRQAAPGEIWRELEPRYIRYVEVLGEDDAGERNKIVTRYFTEADGEKPELTTVAKATYAKKDRFNGKRKGYEFVAASLSELLSLAVLNEVFSAVGSAAAEETPVEDKAEESVSLVSVRQLWQDRQAPLIRLVEVVAVNGGVVEVANRYVQDELDQNPRRVHLDVVEEVSLRTFENEERLRFVTAL
jgi:hypothetical protein